MTTPDPPRPSTPPLALWGGVECTVNRVGDRWFDQIERSGHAARLDDLERFASLGIRAIRYPVLWERTAPEGLDRADWSWPDARVSRLRSLGIEPILGLVHHGSGPRHTHLLDPGFATGLADYAGAVARRYPWVTQWTPVNEPLTTARFSALYGIWYPHAGDDRSFVRALLNQCRATVLAMQAIRAVNPAAQLLQTDDLGKTYSTAPLTGTAAFYNERRWLAWDLLCGRVDRAHSMWRYLIDSGAEAGELLWFADHPCPPDVIGVNYYVTGERWLDHRPERFPACYRGTYQTAPFADIETARALATPTDGIGPLLAETWERYGLPMAITEVHIDGQREDQLRWLIEAWRAAEAQRAAGVDIRALTVWALLGSFDWNCLVRESRGHYEPGPFDVRSPTPRLTALGRTMRSLARGDVPDLPVLQGDGWWRRPERFLCKPVVRPMVVTPLHPARSAHAPGRPPPILVTGATGTLGRAFAALCSVRHLGFVLLDRAAMDLADADSVAAALDRHRPWAVVNASGYVRLDDAETGDATRCFRDNTDGPAVLAAQCARRGIACMTFSSDQVFDGERATPWLEGDRTAPLNVYGHSKAAAERAVLAAHPAALVIRTSAFFGPWDAHNFVSRTLQALEDGEAVDAVSDERVSPTYVPDLVRVALDLLVDTEAGIWHLANLGDVSWAEFAARAAVIAGVDHRRLRPVMAGSLQRPARRPAYGVLGSERAQLMPTLDDALHRYAAARHEARQAALAAAVVVQERVSSRR